jgi:hypothetical protein
MWMFSKWYQDCVTDAGDAFIGYHASLRLNGLTLPYANVIVKPYARPMRSRLTFRKTSQPVFADGRLDWHCDPLGVRGHWSGHASSYRRTLYQAPDGAIRWHCMLPCAQAEVTLEDGRTLTGLGYAEHLEVTLQPWRLPIRELRWGRFLSTEDAVTWIEWRGPVPRRWVFHNGIELTEAVVGHHRIDLTERQSVLTLDSDSVVRTGALTATALRPLRFVRRLLPRGIRNVAETKWIARGTLTGPNHTSTGWAIHETVRWL